MSEQIDFIVADLEAFTQGEIIALGLNVNANLRSNPPLGTPIDTGWASANWLPSVGQPADVDGEPAGKEPTPVEIAARQREADAGLNDLLAWRLDDGPIFSTNNTAYIRRLNDGHSRQSPRGFIPTAIERAINDTYVSAKSRQARFERADAFRDRTGKPPRRP